MRDINKEIDEFVENQLDKDITQEDKINDSVDEQLTQMGFLWDIVMKKLQQDGICFVCKKEMDIKKEVPRLMQASKTEEGTVAFVCLCEQCFGKVKKEKEAEEKKNDRKKEK